MKTAPQRKIVQFQIDVLDKNNRLFYALDDTGKMSCTTVEIDVDGYEEIRDCEVGLDFKKLARIQYAIECREDRIADQMNEHRTEKAYLDPSNQ